MRYLATVVRKQVFGSQQLELHSKEIDKFYWVPTKGEIVSELANPFKPGSLVVVHMSATHQKLQKVEEATAPIIAVFNGLNTIVQRCKELESDIESWKRSMQFQVEELQRRELDLILRAEALHLELSCSLQDISVPPSLMEKSENLQILA